ncbi:MFS transporter [Streptomyces sp. CA-106131]|uniref:MFS transporter n=1 Tax=Streptomyces sp. CA-106131 TaxID=3240045 RepID=UPI003D8E7C79
MAQAQVSDLPRTTTAVPQPLAAPPTGRQPSSFRAVLAHRHCSFLLAASVLGRLPLGMLPVALILTAQTDGHSLATAGLLAALYGIAPAFGLPLLGRLADLRGLPLPCHLGAVTVAVSLSTLALAGTTDLPLAVVCAVLAGAGCPPLEGGLRSLWATLLPDDAHVRTAYALDATTQEIVYVAGPALAVAVATWLSPAAALAVAAAATLAGTLVFAAARPVRTWRAAPRRQDRLGALRPPALRSLLAALVFLGAVVGALDVAAIAAAGHQHAVWLAGTLPAAFAAAGLLGGGLFSRLQPATAPRHRHLLLLASCSPRPGCRCSPRSRLPHSWSWPSYRARCSCLC